MVKKTWYRQADYSSSLPETGILRSIERSSNSHLFLLQRQSSLVMKMATKLEEACSSFLNKEKKEVAVYAKSPTPEKIKTKKSTDIIKMEPRSPTVHFVHVKIAALVGLAFFVSLLLRPYLDTTSTPVTS